MSDVEGQHCLEANILEKENISGLVNGNIIGDVNEFKGMLTSHQDLIK